MKSKLLNLLSFLLFAVLVAAFIYMGMFFEGCANPAVEYAKAKYPQCTLVSTSSKPCGTQMIFQCPYDELVKTCISPQK
jgi:hypothetical protein